MRVLRKKDAEADKAVNMTESYFVASQWQLMYRKFKKHKLARIGVVVLVLFYFAALFCEFLAPYRLETRYIQYVHSPPWRIRFFDKGKLNLRPFVYDVTRKIDPESLLKTYTPDKNKKHPIHFFVHGETYEFWGLFETDIHFFGVKDGGHIFLLGTDRLGRDMFSRILHGARISLSIGLVGVFLSLFIGLLLGGMSGYFGGAVDNFVQRTIEVIRSFPTVPLWLALSAAIPAEWSSVKVYFGITVIISFIGWTDIARVVRGKILALREEDYVMAAQISGCGDMSIMARHLLPGFLSYIIVSISLAVPYMILAETALSFLGLGLRPPVTSWGVLLKEAQNVRSVALYPWLLIPVLFVIITILAFNFVGDGLRDAADPYK